jgi:hypothetical protein
LSLFFPSCELKTVWKSVSGKLANSLKMKRTLYRILCGLILPGWILQILSLFYKEFAQYTLALFILLIFYL